MCYHWNLSNIIETKHPNTKHNANNMIWSSVSPRTTKFDSTVLRNFRESKEEYTLQLLTFGSIEDFEQTHHSIQTFIWQRQTRCGQWKSHRTTCRTTKKNIDTSNVHHSHIHSMYGIFTNTYQVYHTFKATCRYLIPYMEPVGLIQLPVKPPRGWKRIYLA